MGFGTVYYTSILVYNCILIRKFSQTLYNLEIELKRRAS
jgi:hypothetical protein